MYFATDKNRMDMHLIFIYTSTLLLRSISKPLCAASFMKNCSGKKLTTVLTVLPALGQCMRISVTMQTTSGYFSKHGSEGVFLNILNK